MSKKPGDIEEKKRGEMTVREAGRKGGEKVKEKYGRGFYSKIGHKGGQRVKKLIFIAYENYPNPKH